MKKFVKNHLIINSQKSNVIKKIIQGDFALYFDKNYLLSFNQFKAIIFFCRKKLKFYSKLFIRLNPSLKNTSKAIGIRMGKGKGGLDSYYFSVLKGQIFLEFGFKRGNKNVIKNQYDYIKLKDKIRFLTKLVSKKLAIDLNYIIKEK